MTKFRFTLIACVGVAVALASIAYNRRERAEMRLVQAAAATPVAPPVTKPQQDIVHLTVPRGAIFERGERVYIAIQPERCIGID